MRSLKDWHYPIDISFKGYLEKVGEYGESKYVQSFYD